MTVVEAIWISERDLLFVPVTRTNHDHIAYVRSLHYSFVDYPLTRHKQDPSTSNPSSPSQLRNRGGAELPFVADDVCHNVESFCIMSSFYSVTASVPRSSECIADVVLGFFWQ
jgi:hypothetical protein